MDYHHLMKAYKVTLIVLPINQDVEDEAAVEAAFENLDYPEFVHVLGIESRDIGEWSDDHPLNKTATCDAAYKKLFP